MPSRYFDIDDVLADDEVVPCTTVFDFDYLSELDPDYSHYHQRRELQKKRKRRQRRESQKKRQRQLEQSGALDGDFSDGDQENFEEEEHEITQGSCALPEGHKIDVPLWALDKWATIGFVRVGLPKMYRRKARERLLADPASAALQENFFTAGKRAVDLIDSTQPIVSEIESGRRGGTRSWRREQSSAMKQALSDSKRVRSVLLQTYGGERLRQNLDWCLNTVDDDVSSFTRRLSIVERQLFHLGAEAFRSHTTWKNTGARIMAAPVAPALAPYSAVPERSNVERAVSPETV